MAKISKEILWACLAATVGSSWLMAQTTISSTMLGTVTDAQKAVVPGTQVTLKNVDTGQEWKTVTGGVGEYAFPNLKAGNYSVETTKAGFKNVVSEVISLENGSTQRVDLTMPVGVVTEQVTVVGAAPILETDEANVSQILENRIVADVPVEGRSFLDYATLAPLFNSGSGDTVRKDWGMASVNAPGGKVLNLGGTEYSVGYYIDGVNSNDNWVEGPTVNMNMDSIQEVKVEMTNYSAEYGREVGQLSLTTKSGTNTLHGSVYDYRKVNGLNARAPYTIFEDPERGRDHWHHDQFGFTAGGPVVLPKIYNGRNKAFFFVAYEGYRRNGFDTQLAYTPTARERNGDFGEWLERFPGDPSMVIYDPFSFDPATQERQPYANNIIPNPNPKALEYLSHFPLPNFTSPIAEDIRNWSGTIKAHQQYDNFVARFDYSPSNKDQFSLKYTRDSGSTLRLGGLIPELGTGGDGPNNRLNSINANWVRAFSPTFTNEFAFQYSLGHLRPDDPEIVRNLMQIDWFRNLFENTSLPGGGLNDFEKGQLETDEDAIYAIGIGGPFDSVGLGRYEWWFQYIPQWQFDDKVTKVFGRHTLKAGVRHFRREERDNDVIRWAGVYGGYTGRGPFVPDGSGWNTLAEFAAGTVTEMIQRNIITGGDSSLWFRSPEWSWFVGDKWQATRNLTLDIGLRHEYAAQMFAVNDYWGVLDKQYPGLRMYSPGLTPGSKNPPYPSDKNNLAPRIGIAYRLGEKWVVRAGYGIFYDTGRYKFMDQMFFTSPGYGGAYFNSQDQASINGLDPNQVWFTLDNTFPASPELARGDWPVPIGDKGGLLGERSDTFTIDEVTPIAPYLQRWSLDIQRQVGRHSTLTLGYVGSKGTKLTINDDLNLPPEGVYLTSEDFHLARPNSIADGEAYVDRFGEIQAIHRGGNNAYHALTGKFEKKFSGGMSLLTHYTWSKMTDEFFNTFGYTNVSAIGGQWHRDWAHGLSDANHTHRFVGTLVYQLPFGNSLNGAAKTLLAGWQINFITVFESGSPATVFNGDTSSFDYMGDVPVRVCDGNVGSGSFFQYFDTSCFVNPDADPDTGIAVSRGNGGRNIITMPGINNWDASIFKKFILTESKQLEFRMETFNTFNHPQWSSVDTWNDTGTNPFSTFGRVNGGRPGRQIQFALKFIF